MKSMVGASLLKLPINMQIIIYNRQYQGILSMHPSNNLS